ncbi:hypothetical protein ANCDUO_01564 [Ancylostoma duodenale]|uniref:Reverse transcriptase RNase H-like domain-containing protein n=1 Tax=Ancylostoma duodenale TaxID=51022 RepID=A0A0C2DDU4_9BILA|nr:hypothetical protein ANCDUO_01564 [Ancylostoma duodenale]
MIAYYGPFVAERQLCSLLDALLKKNVSFKWNEGYDAAFTRAKGVLASDLLLTHFDPSANNCCGRCITLWSRSSDPAQDSGWHREGNMSCKSKSAAEKKNVQIEKEFALIFAVWRFHRYTCGRRLKLLADHRPLLHIFGPKKESSMFARLCSIHKPLAKKNAL